MAKCGGNEVTPKPPVVSTCPTVKGEYCVFPFKSGKLHNFYLHIVYPCQAQQRTKSAPRTRGSTGAQPLSRRMEHTKSTTTVTWQSVETLVSITTIILIFIFLLFLQSHQLSRLLSPTVQLTRGRTVSSHSQMV